MVFNKQKVNALAPVFINTGMTGNPTPEALIEQLKEGNDSVRIDTVSLNNRIPGLNKVLLLVTGDHEIKTSTSTEFPSRTVWVASPSPNEFIFITCQFSGRFFICKNKGFPVVSMP